ncbi:MAG: TerB family tellurite resistance protein, partial [Bacteroidales bacterium]|nr:TerB family tellurite resistance protein [Bacteroidales bacterium]
ATLRADGKVDTAEVEVIKRVAADLECDASEITKLLLEENEKQAKCPDICAYIVKICKSVENAEDKQLIMEACIQVALADKELATKEIAVLLMICRALDCGLERLVCDIAICAQNDRDIKIEGSDADFTEEFIEEEENELSNP